MPPGWISSCLPLDCSAGERFRQSTRYHSALTHPGGPDGLLRTSAKRRSPLLLTTDRASADSSFHGKKFARVHLLGENRGSHLLGYKRITGDLALPMGTLPADFRRGTQSTLLNLGLITGSSGYLSMSSRTDRSSTARSNRGGTMPRLVLSRYPRQNQVQSRLAGGRREI